MFVVGQTYTITMMRHTADGAGSEDLHNCVAADWDQPLLRIRQFEKEMIINTASPMFAYARPQESEVESPRGPSVINTPDYGSA